jgi:hypothetical protein
MADTEFNDPKGITYPSDSTIQKLNLITSDGSRMDMKKLLIEFSYHEDIYSFCINGYVAINDAQGFIENLQLTGNEFIEVNFGKVKDAQNDDDQIFRVYKIGDRKPSRNMTSEAYKLFFCSEEFLLSEQIKVTQSYKGQRISDIVTDILTNKLKVSDKIDVIDDTTGVYDFIIPRMKPLEAISWLSTYARPAGYSGSDMLFFESRYGFTFRSLQSMYTDDVYQTYKFQPKNLSDDITQTQDKVTTILEYEILKTYDSLNEISSGVFSNRLISIDPMTRSYYTTDFDYSDYINKSHKLNKFAPTNYLTNRLNKNQTQNYESVVKVVTSNSNEINVPYIKNKGGAGIAKDIFIETYVPYRTAQIPLANYTTIKLTIPGDPGIYVGTPIEFALNTLDSGKPTKESDRFYSGKYLVTAVRHMIQTAGVFQTVLEISKESTQTQYAAVNNDSTILKEVVKS